ncbi:hypothetical protein like AT4G12840 [Hibiscus trionum]|uniref:Uncharacterized protein n=1 Tax=Hibiscus trionum TaxID=183268 RepID=A0A9W7I4B6_HIBTR|nr:hypothetical protein like AT4G12840 [Hibiscus trionum]
MCYNKAIHFIPLVAERKVWGSCLCILAPVTALLSMVYLLGSLYVEPETRERAFTWRMADILQSSNVQNCQIQCRPPGSEPLPEGIVENKSNLQMRPLWGFPKKENTSTSLLAVAVGIKQKDLVDKLVTTFLSSGFVVMLFHYDGIVDEWKHFEWCDKVIHVSARNQTKWWFAKRFLHPDIVSEYSYIFLWDEDLGVEYFRPEVYVSIIEHEGLEISQPALDRSKSEVHHQITARERKSVVHRRTFKQQAKGKRCDGHSKDPPCTGWIEMMAPVFSRAAWRCVWYMIQNDLIHAWGLDMQVGYCAQGDRTNNIGIVDAEYVIHHNRPSLGGVGAENHSNVKGRRVDKGNRIKGIVVDAEYILRHYPMLASAAEKNNSTLKGGHHIKNSHNPHSKEPRVEIRRQSFVELYLFRRRWENAVKKDKCWVDPYN